MGLKVDAEVKQLSWGGAYVNVLRHLKGGVGLWGYAYKHPTYLLLAGDNWLIITYDTEAWRDGSLEQAAEVWGAEKVLELPTLKEVNWDE